MVSILRGNTWIKIQYGITIREYKPGKVTVYTFPYDSSDCIKLILAVRHQYSIYDIPLQ